MCCSLAPRAVQVCLVNPSIPPRAGDSPCHEWAYTWGVAEMQILPLSQTLGDADLAASQSPL